VKLLILAELRNGPGTVTEITERLQRQFSSVYETQVHTALRSLVDSGAVMTHVKAVDSYAFRDGDAARKSGREPGVFIYEIADGGIWKEVG